MKKLTLKTTKKLFKKMQRKLSQPDFENFVDKFWNEVSHIDASKTEAHIVVIAL